MISITKTTRLVQLDKKLKVIRISIGISKIMNK